jgi:hypothetical protein
MIIPALPLEIFSSIFDQLVRQHWVQTNILDLTIQLRLVCRMFDQEITKAICRAQILDDFIGAARYRVGDNVFKEYLSYRMLHVDVKRLRKDYWSRTILDTTDFICQYSKAKQPERDETIRFLCALAVQNNPIKAPENQNNAREPYFQFEVSLKQNVLAASSALGIDGLVELLVSEDIMPLATIYGTPITCAAQANHINLVYLLLSHQTTPTQFIDAAKEAVVSKNRDFLAELIDRRHNYTDGSLGEFYSQVIQKIAGHGDVETLTYVLQRAESTPNLMSQISQGWEKFSANRDPLQCMILKSSVFHIQADIVHFALSNGAYFKWPEDKSLDEPYLTVLGVAVYQNSEPVVRMLLEAGKASALKHETDGWKLIDMRVPLLSAAKRGYIGVANALIDYGADVNLFLEGDQLTLDDDGDDGSELPLIAATRCNQVEMVRVLLQRGAKLHWRPEQNYERTVGQAMWVYCEMYGFTCLLKILAEYGIQKNDELQGFLEDFRDSFNFNSDPDWEDSSASDEEDVRS